MSDATLNAAGSDAPAASASGGTGELELSSGGTTNAGQAGAVTGEGGATQPSGDEGGAAGELGGAGIGGRSDASTGESDGGASNAGGSAGGSDASAGGSDATVGGSDATVGSSTAGGDAGRPPALQPGDPVKGHQLVILDNCSRCHGDNLAGRSFYRNITPDLETGIGAWTDQQIATAVLGAVGPSGEIFCATMPLYSGLKAQQVADLIAYLRVVPAVKNQIVPVCPGHNP